MWLLVLCGQLLLVTNPAVQSIVVTGPGTNNWIVITNGSLWLPPFTFPSEDGGDGQRGGIYFGPAGSTGAGQYGPASYILNIVNRGPRGGQLLISHQAIALEEQTLGEVLLGNDGSGGGLIRIRYDDEMGHNLVTNEPGHAHVLMFEPRRKSATAIHSANPGIIAYHGGGPDEFPGDLYRGWGPVGRGELAFYTSVPWPGFGSVLTGGLEMGRMTTNGWDFRGALVRQRLSFTNYSSWLNIDLSQSYLTDVTLTTNTTVTSFGARISQSDVLSSVILLRAGPYPRIVRCPNWIPRSPAPPKAPIPIPANGRLWIDLDSISGETYATFRSVP